MSNFKLEFECDNAAFFDADDNFDASEVASILRSVARSIDKGQEAARVYDSNGNRIGSFYLKIDGENDDEEDEEWDF